MPWKTTLEHATEDKREGKAPTTQAGEFVREEIEHVRRGTVRATPSSYSRSGFLRRGARAWT
jgi:hypothetical protein